ncbi:Scn5a [Symbiodinium sp. CCMP2456]|nr:Scn5a [Symbiodinium sp. CCMP2456]
MIFRTCEPFVKVFDEEVKHLGLRVAWSAQRPTIQRVDEGTAAQVVGICPGDLLLAINDTETEGRPREELLPLLRDRPLRLRLVRKGSDCSVATGTMTFGTPKHLSKSITGKQTQPALKKTELGKVAAVKNVDDSRGREANLTNAWADSPVSVVQGRAAPDSPRKISSRQIGRRDGRKTSKGSRAASTANSEDEPEGSHTQLGLRRFIATRKESTASVAEVGIGNFKISIHDQADEPKSCARRLHSLLKWWNHLEDRGGCAYKSRPFFTLSSTVIMMHAVVVTMSSDWEVNHIGGTPPPHFNYLEMGFLAFYALELGLRLTVHRCFFFIGESAGWNCFDFLLVAFSGFDVGLFFMQLARHEQESGSGNVSFMRMFRLFKITKILRTIRIIKVFRELSMMVESFTKCLVAMFWGLTLLIFLLYIFAQPVLHGSRVGWLPPQLQTTCILDGLVVAKHKYMRDNASFVFVQGVTDLLREQTFSAEDEQSILSQFGSVLDSMLSLYMAVTGGNDWVEYYETVRQCGPFYDVLFLLYTFFFVFALFNIMTGVFVERALTAAIPDRDEMIWEEQKKLAKQVEDFKALCNQLDTDNSGTITKTEFKKHMRSDVMVSYMSSVGLEMHDVEHFFRTVAGEDQEVSIDRFVEGCMAMRGNATALDVQRQLFECKRLSDAIKSLKREHSENMSKVQWILLKAFPRLADEMPKIDDKAQQSSNPTRSQQSSASDKVRPSSAGRPIPIGSNTGEASSKASSPTREITSPVSILAKDMERTTPVHAAK